MANSNLTYTNTQVLKYYPTGNNKDSIVIRVALLLEDLIKKTIFRRNDLNTKSISRVIMASSGYEFRKRFIQLGGNAIDKNENLELENKDKDKLNLDDIMKLADDMKLLPFACYDIINHNIEPMITNNAYALENGYALASQYVSTPMIKGELKIPVKFYFNRYDDLQTCYQIILYESYTSRVLNTEYLYNNISLINIPVSIKPIQVTFNKNDNEKSWLSKNKIFSLECIYDVITLIPKIDTLSMTYESDGYDYTDIVDKHKEDEGIKGETTEYNKTLEAILNFRLYNKELSIKSNENLAIEIDNL